MLAQDKFDSMLQKIALVGAGSMFALPFLNARHYAPIPSFYAEWLAAATLLVAGLFLLTREVWARPLIPKITLLPLSLACLALLQWIFVQGGQTESLVFFLLYLLGATLAMVVGQSLSQAVGFPRLAQMLANCLLMGALLSALIAVVSKFAPQWLPSMIENNRNFGVMRGNLMQPNHLANYLWMGITAACFLHLARRLRANWLAAALAPLLVVAAMTGSRSPVVYLLGMNLLSWLWWYRSRSPRAVRLLRLTLLLVPLFSLALGASHLLGIATAANRITSDVTESTSRPDGPASSTSIKILQSELALGMFAEKPLLGNGIGSYGWGSFVLAEKFPLPPAGYKAHSEHAHNLPAHLLAELGIGGLLALVISLLIWWRRFAQLKWASAHVWVLMVLMIEAWHSMVEYPLWYAYFLLPTTLLLGAGDSKAIKLQNVSSVSRLNGFRGLATIVLLSAAMVMGAMWTDYLRLAYVIKPELKTGQPTQGGLLLAATNPELLDLYENSLFSQHAGLIYAKALGANRELLADKLMLVKRAVRFEASSQIVFKYALLLALAGRHDESLQQLRWAMRAYPNALPGVISELRTLLVEDPLLPFAALLKNAEIEQGLLTEH